MKLVIPKASRGFVFQRLFSVEMNSFDVERLLPSLFFLVVTRGRERGVVRDDPTAIAQSVVRLAEHAMLQGFDDEAGHRLLERWVRASVAHIGKVGRGRVAEKIDYIIPRTILAYKPGFPAQSSYRRNVHSFLYEAMESALENVSPQEARRLIGAAFAVAFGDGVKIGDAPTYDGRYDGTSSLDIHTLLTLRYLEGFEPTEAGKKEVASAFGPALPCIARQMGADVLGFVDTYARSLPTQELVRELMALINFELFIYTLKLVYATNALVSDHSELPPAMREVFRSSPPDIYVDFSSERGSESDRLAHDCVVRDLEELRAFYESAMRLRTLNRCAETGGVPPVGASTPECLSALLHMEDCGRTQVWAQLQVEQTERDTLEANPTTEGQDIRDLFQQWRGEAGDDSLGLLVRLLCDAQRKNALGAYAKWFVSVGGVRKNYGMLTGNTKGRHNWRYAMTDDLLATLVHLAMIPRFERRREGGDGQAVRLPLLEFLSLLETRYGLIVGRPPEFANTTAAARDAAHTNLEAMKRRLRQMGYFQALSDDFSAQYLSMTLDEEVTA